MTAEDFFYNHWQKANKSKFGDYGEYDSDEYAIAFAKDYAALCMQAVVGQSEQCAHTSTDIRTLRCNCCNDCGEILEMID